MAKRRVPRFFRNRQKPMEDVVKQTDEGQTVDTDVIAETPVEEQVEIPEEVTPEPTAETPTETPVDDRSAFNCESCSGEGLVGDPAGVHQICATCSGTGKV